MRFLLIISILITMLSCNKGEEEIDYYLEFDGKKYELDQSHYASYINYNIYDQRRHYHQIQIFGKNLKMRYDSDNRYYSSAGEGLTLSFYLQSIDTNALNDGFYDYLPFWLNDSVPSNSYLDVNVFDLDSDRIRLEETESNSPIYFAIKNRQLEVRGENIKFYAVDSTGDTVKKLINVHYKGKYFGSH